MPSTRKVVELEDYDKAETIKVQRLEMIVRRMKTEHGLIEQQAWR